MTLPKPLLACIMGLASVQPMPLCLSVSIQLMLFVVVIMLQNSYHPPVFITNCVRITLAAHGAVDGYDQEASRHCAEGPSQPRCNHRAGAPGSSGKQAWAQEAFKVRWDVALQVQLRRTGRQETGGVSRRQHAETHKKHAGVGKARRTCSQGLGSQAGGRCRTGATWWLSAEKEETRTRATGK